MVLWCNSALTLLFCSFRDSCRFSAPVTAPICLSHLSHILLPNWSHSVLLGCLCDSSSVFSISPHYCKLSSCVLPYFDCLFHLSTLCPTRWFNSPVYKVSLHLAYPFRNFVCYFEIPEDTLCLNTSLPFPFVCLLICFLDIDFAFSFFGFAFACSFLPRPSDLLVFDASLFFLLLLFLVFWLCLNLWLPGIDLDWLKTRILLFRGLHPVPSTNITL